MALLSAEDRSHSRKSSLCSWRGGEFCGLGSRPIVDCPLHFRVSVGSERSTRTLSGLSANVDEAGKSWTGPVRVAGMEWNRDDVLLGTWPSVRAGVAQ